MKVTKKESVQGDWAKILEDIDTGNIVTILDAGQRIMGEYGERDVFSVKTRNGAKNLTFNQTTKNHLIDTWGDETEKWVGKKVKVWIVKMMVSGKMRNVIFLTPPDWIEGKDGFEPPNTKGDGDIPIIEDEGGGEQEDFGGDEGGLD